MEIHRQWPPHQGYAVFDNFKSQNVSNLKSQSVFTLFLILKTTLGGTVEPSCIPKCETRKKFLGSLGYEKAPKKPIYLQNTQRDRFNRAFAKNYLLIWQISDI